MRKLSLVYFVFFLNMSAFGLRAQPRAISQRNRTMLNHAVTTYVRKNTGYKGKFSTANVDVQGSWAELIVVPKDKNFDNALCILRKQKNHWRVIMFGTGMSGEGKKFGVPKHLQKRWGV